MPLLIISNKFIITMWGFCNFLDTRCDLLERAFSCLVWCQYTCSLTWYAAGCKGGHFFFCVRAILDLTSGKNGSVVYFMDGKKKNSFPVGYLTAKSLKIVFRDNRFSQICSTIHSKLTLPFKGESYLYSVGSTEQHASYFHVVWHHLGIC